MYLKLSDQQQRQATLSALEDSVTTMLDGILFALSAAQLWLAPVPQGQPISKASVIVVFTAFKIGQTPYIYGSFTISFFLLFAWLAECTRTRFWRGLVRWDYSDLEHVITAVQDGISGQTKNAKDVSKILKARHDGRHALLLDHDDSRTPSRMSSTKEHLTSTMEELDTVYIHRNTIVTFNKPVLGC